MCYEPNRKVITCLVRIRTRRSGFDLSTSNHSIFVDVLVRIRRRTLRVICPMIHRCVHVSITRGTVIDGR